MNVQRLGLNFYQKITIDLVWVVLIHKAIFVTS